MAILYTQINPCSAEFAANAATMLEQVSALHTLLDRIHEGDDSATQAQHSTYGKLLVRERISRPLDPSSPFLEFSALITHEVYDEEVAVAGIIAGTGRAEGVEYIVISNDVAVKGGTYYPLTMKKHLRARAIVLENHLPCIYLVDSGGASLSRQDEVLPDRKYFDRIFFNQANMSARGIPQIAVVVGSCTADGAYVPAMSDETVMVREQAIIFFAGPPLVKAATGKMISAEELGGTDVHCEISGVTDHYAEDDDHALAITRRCVASLNRRKQGQLQCRTPHAPLYPAEELYGVIPADSKQPYGVRGVIARLVDGSKPDELKALFDTVLVCGFAHLHGYPIAILANNEVLFTRTAQKGAHFIELACQRGIPLLFLRDATGFMIGQECEVDGVARHDTKLVTAVTCARVPKFIVLIGGSLSAGNYGMCERAYDPRFLWMRPNTRTGVMGDEQTVGMLTQTKREQAEHAGQQLGVKEEAKIRAPILEQYEYQGHPYYSSARLWNDGVIDPAQTRGVLALTLPAALNAPVGPTVFGAFRM